MDIHQHFSCNVIVNSVKKSRIVLHDCVRAYKVSVGYAISESNLDKANKYMYLGKMSLTF